MNEFFRHASSAEPWKELDLALRETLTELRANSTAFRNTQQADAVIEILFEKLLPSYRAHHSDLLLHLTDAGLLQPFFVARCFEALLGRGGPWNESQRITEGALRQLNDFVGYRPVAVLERKRCEPYDHEWVRPIPLYIRASGTAVGAYHDLVSRAIEILAGTDPGILREAQFELELLDELALDPRAYDFGHPVNQRPNYQFGEWDPHCIDNAGKYRRFVVRQITLDALLQRVIDSTPRVPHSENSLRRESIRVPTPSGSAGSASASQSVELLFEASAVLAGTMLMASGISGSGPDAHDSSITLATLIPRIARLRDSFYERLIETVPGTHGAKLRDEATRLHQPFGGARQYLNHFLARCRAGQLQHTHLAQLYTEMGYPEAGRGESVRVRTASERITTEMRCRIISSLIDLDQGNLAAACSTAISLEDLLQRGIRCGAMVDPWNILGFQGQFSVFPAIENTVPDPRVDRLTELMERVFLLYSRLISEAAALGDEQSGTRVRQRFQKLAAWWDQFATIEIAGIRPVHGRKTLEAATHVAEAMAAWRDAGEGAGNIRFWREHSGGFHSPRAFAQVVEALLEKRDYVAAMALLMSWLSQANDVPLHQDPHSFHDLAVRWLLGVIRDNRCGKLPNASAWTLVMKFFDYMEANAEEYWLVPSFELGKNLTGADDLSREHDASRDIDDEADANNVYAAAYDGVTYRDSAHDGQEGELVEGGPVHAESEWQSASERLEPRLQFLTTIARLLRIAADHWLEMRLESQGTTGNPASDREKAIHPEQVTGDADRPAVLVAWLQQLRRNQVSLSALVQHIERAAIPQPLGSHESLVEYDRNRGIREHLIYVVIASQAETLVALRRLLCAYPSTPDDVPMAQWERRAVAVERALARDESEAIRALLPSLLEAVSREPLLYRRLDRGGEARQIVAARNVQQTLKVLLESLPRVGLLRDTYLILRTARQMEQGHPVGEGVTEFDQLARTALRATVESIVDASVHWTPVEQADESLLHCLETATQPFLKLWLEHSQSVRLTSLDRVRDEAQWQEIRQFIESYGHDLLTPVFLTPGNLRAILDQGVGHYLDYLIENPDPLRPNRLIEHLEQRISRADARRLLELVMQVFVENYEEYKDYNSTTTQSDYGERFFILFEFLRLKALYVRATWNLQPLSVIHEALARRGKSAAAQLWQQTLTEKTRTMADGLLDRLCALEAHFGVRLATVRDLISERFTRPLALNRAAILIGPAMEQARTKPRSEEYSDSRQSNELAPAAPLAGSMGASIERNAFRQFQEALHEFAETTSGVGLDVPPWLRRLEEEVQRLRQRERITAEAIDDSRRLRSAQFSRAHVDSELDALEAAESESG